MKLKIILIILLSLVLFSINYGVKKFYIEKEILNSQKDNQELIENSKKNIFYISDIIYNVIIDDEIVNILSLKNRELIRKKLKQLLQNKYDFLKTKHVLQIHFYSPDKTSLFRFHKEEAYGDYLGDIRESMNRAFKELKPVHSFEMGRVIDGFRTVFPIMKDKKLIGGVEISFSFDIFREFIGNNYFLVLNKSLVNNTIFENDRINYVDYPLDKEYLITKKEFLNGKFCRLREFKDEVSSINGAKLYMKNGEYYLLDTILLKDLLNQNFGKIIYFAKSTDIKYVMSEYVKYNYMIIVLTILSLLTIYFYEKLQVQTKLASKDELTKTLNRRGCNQEIKVRIPKDLYASLIIFDIDFFKNVNDKYGHDVGDEVLKEVSNIVFTSIRANDIFCRIGGEEFVIYLSNAKLKDAKRVAQNIRKLIEGYKFRFVGHVTISMGVTEKFLSDDLDTLIKRADSALYRAKNLGRNRVQSDKI